VARAERSVEVLTQSLGFGGGSGDGAALRLVSRAGGAGSSIELLERPGVAPGRLGAGTVHHVAFRARDDQEQNAWRDALSRRGLAVTPVQDRCYFHSIYFREPGGVLYEIATDPPGFSIDESVAELGLALKLPPWLESARPDIERSLPAIRLPQAERVP
jgi:glyoxalase family protein